MVSQVQRFKKIVALIFNFGIQSKVLKWSATPHQVSWNFLLVDILGEHYIEECHKQWLALGFTSELVSQVQNSKDYISHIQH